MYSFPLGIFHLVGVLWNMRIAVPEVNHLLDERENISGLETSAGRGDLIEELADGDFFVES